MSISRIENIEVCYSYATLATKHINKYAVSLELMFFFISMSLQCIAL